MRLQVKRLAEEQGQVAKQLEQAVCASGEALSAAGTWKSVHQAVDAEEVLSFHLEVSYACKNIEEGTANVTPGMHHVRTKC